jgi:hypothetical protein
MKSEKNEFSRSTVGSAGPASPRPPLAAAHRPAAARACPAHDAGRGAPAATPAPRQQPLGRARTRAAGSGEGGRRSVGIKKVRAQPDFKTRAPLSGCVRQVFGCGHLDYQYTGVHCVCCLLGPIPWRARSRRSGFPAHRPPPPKAQCYNLARTLFT